MTMPDSELDLANQRIAWLEDEVVRLKRDWISPHESQELRGKAWADGHAAALRGVNDNPYLPVPSPRKSQR